MSHDDAAGSHDLKPQHSGTVVHLANHGPAIEIVHDAEAGTITLHAYDAEGETQKLDEAPIARIETTQVTGKGAADKWTFTHDTLKGHPHGVSFKVTVGGKTYNNDTWHPEGDDQ